MKRLLAVLLSCLFLALPAWAMTVDLNTATEADLDSLPGIGPAKAADIIAWRDANGGFTSPAQLDEVPGIGPATLSRLLPLVSIDGAVSAAPAHTEAPAPSTAPPEPSGDIGLMIQAAPVQAQQHAPTATSSIVTPSSDAGRIDINTASADQLMSLPGIGGSKASLIVASRSQQGPFSSCADLQRVNGIGAKTVQNLEHLCTTGGGSAPTSTRSASSSHPPAASPAPSGNRVDINSASAAQLDSLPGIGASKAALIVASREQQGPYTSCADLQRVNGIGAKTVQNLEHMCTAN